LVLYKGLKENWASQAAEKVIVVKGTAFTGCRKAQLSETFFCGFLYHQCGCPISSRAPLLWRIRHDMLDSLVESLRDRVTRFPHLARSREIWGTRLYSAGKISDP
jgi:hypothetical protein